MLYCEILNYDCIFTRIIVTRILRYNNGWSFMYNSSQKFQTQHNVKKYA